MFFSRDHLLQIKRHSTARMTFVLSLAIWYAAMKSDPRRGFYRWTSFWYDVVEVRLAQWWSLLARKWWSLLWRSVAEHLGCLFRSRKVVCFVFIVCANVNWTRIGAFWAGKIRRNKYDGGSREEVQVERVWFPRSAIIYIFITPVKQGKPQRKHKTITIFNAHVNLLRQEYNDPPEWKGICDLLRHSRSGFKYADYTSKCTEKNLWLSIPVKWVWLLIR